ncbi:hypothetical protein BRM06_14385 [Xanthomonas oryzae pv. oryzae]|uniref:hypothetical protein n=1 Tax=Xanthomonas oryzae TaxID=347 RepID=UPI000CAB2A93|nr:hypothetical protein [Xanthomonas oryzae]PNR90594.1 hypothetical protein LA05_01835 [Xanthomonas oryzae pv. oryzae]RBH08730.1 hypothetical protein BRM06_14385 [Xanthomonas oryzae pv. oryzae]RBH64047.1 hypothetical protein BRM05_16205 [Xanthomonas oryzae pv. oryzae]
MLQIRAEGAQPGFVLFDQAGEKVALGGHLAEFVVFAHVPAPKVRAVLRVRGARGRTGAGMTEISAVSAYNT